MSKRLALILGAALAGLWLGSGACIVVERLASLTQRALSQDSVEVRDEAGLDSNVLDY